MKNLLFLVISAFILFACNNVDTKTEKENDENVSDVENNDCQHQGKCRNAISVDELMENIDMLVDQEVSVRGKCTHICDHSGKNIFVNSNTNEGILIIGKAAEEIDKFDKSLEGKEVMIKGKLIAVEVENEEEIEVHHDVELNYYIEVVEVKECCTGGQNHNCTGEHNHDCTGEHKHDCTGEHKHVHEENVIQE